MRRVSSCTKKTDKKNGFSLLEIIITIIVIGLCMSAILESFVVGSAKSVNIVNEETAINVAKQITAALNYCRNGGTGTVNINGASVSVCSAFVATTPSKSLWNSNPSSLDTLSPSPLAQPVNNQCFYTTITASNIGFTDTNGNITGSSSTNPDYIQAIVQTGWFAESAPNTCPAAPAGCPGTSGSCPYVTVSTVYADY